MAASASASAGAGAGAGSTKQQQQKKKKSRHPVNGVQVFALNLRSNRWTQSCPAESSQFMDGPISIAEADIIRARQRCDAEHYRGLSLGAVGDVCSTLYPVGYAWACLCLQSLIVLILFCVGYVFPMTCFASCRGAGRSHGRAGRSSGSAPGVPLAQGIVAQRESWDEHPCARCGWCRCVLYCAFYIIYIAVSVLLLAYAYSSRGAS